MGMKKDLKWIDGVEENVRRRLECRKWWMPLLKTETNGEESSVRSTCTIDKKIIKAIIFYVIMLK